MLTTKVIPEIGKPSVTVKGGTVVVCDEFDNPLVVVMSIGDKTHMISTHRDHDFNRILQSIGIDRVVVDSQLLIDAPPKDAELLFNPHKRNQRIVGGAG